MPKKLCTYTGFFWENRVQCNAKGNEQKLHGIKKTFLQFGSMTIFCMQHTSNTDFSLQLVLDNCQFGSCSYVCVCVCVCVCVHPPPLPGVVATWAP